MIDLRNAAIAALAASTVALAAYALYVRSELQQARLETQHILTTTAQADARRANEAQKADAANRVIEFNRTEAVNAALQQALDRAKSAEVLSAGLRAECDGLRNDRAAALAAASSDLSSDPLGACRRYAAAADAVLGELEERGEELARAAAGHASDSLTFQQAWPRR